MTNKKAIEVFKLGSKMTELTSETLDEACRLAYQALRKEPHICTILGVWPEQVFFWRGYRLMVDEGGTVCKSMKNNLWLGLEGRMVCDLINNNEEIIRSVAKGKNDPLTLDELREMSGEPVWCIDGYGNHCWCLVNCDDGLPCCYDNETGLWDGCFYHMIGDGKYGLHQSGWLAYRRKPEEGKT